jgi:cell division septation protein DedD
MSVRGWCVAAVLMLASSGGAAAAQNVDSAAKQSAASDPRDTLFLRARRMVLEGNGTAGRAIVDSALTAAAGMPDYGVALYWRAALAATAADAERDYRRVIVEYPFSPHSGDALLALAQLEMARGDRESAIDHLQRFLLQQPPSDPERVRASIWLGRLLLEQNQLAKGCAVLLRTRSTLGDTAVEIRNQVDYYAARCAGVDTAAPPPPSRRPGAVAPPPATAAAPPRSKAAAATPRRDTVRSPNAPRAPAGRYTVQVAAYDSKAAAQDLVTKLGGRGILARFVGATAPYRVRVGHYATDAEAAAAAKQLKTKGIDGFVTTTDNERATAPERK